MELAKQSTDLLENFRRLEEMVPTMTNDQLVNLHTQLKAVHSVSLGVGEAVKQTLKNRKDDVGRDAKGNSYFTDGETTLVVGPRHSFSLTDDAYDKLAEAELLHLFPQEPDIAKMHTLLDAAGIPKHHYCTFVVSVETLTNLVNQREIDFDFAKNLMVAKTTYAVRTAVQKELPSD